jgi:hypothetical protein
MTSAFDCISIPVSGMLILKYETMIKITGDLNQGLLSKGTAVYRFIGSFEMQRQAAFFWYWHIRKNYG